MDGVVVKYLKSLKFTFSEKYIKKLISSHPDYPSLLSVSDVLERLGISAIIGRVEKNNISQIEFPYVLHLERKLAEFVLIKSEDDIKKLEKDLEKFWNGIILKIEPTDHITDEDHHKEYSEERFYNKIWIVLLSVAATLLIILSVVNFSLFPALLLTTAIGGLTIGYLLVAKDLGVTYKAVESFCSAGKKANCNVVLNSEYATFFGRVKLSDIVFSYFTCQLLVIGVLVPLINYSGAFLLPIAAGSILAIPVMASSIYYQHVIVKSWCKLCLVIDVILLVQALLFSWMFYKGLLSLTGMNASLFSLTVTGLLFLAVISAELFVKDKLKQLKASQQSEVTANRVKYSVSVFTHLLFRERKVDVTPFEQEIMIGNPDAPINIMVACNLFCGPCKMDHKKVSHIINTYPEKVNLSIRFVEARVVKGIELNPREYLYAYWLKNIYRRENQYQKTAILLHDWFEEMKLPAFAKRYPLDSDSDVVDMQIALNKLITKHDEWMEESKITKTPTFFINGYELPDGYRINDLMSLVPGLNSYFQNYALKKNGQHLKKREEITG